MNQSRTQVALLSDSMKVMILKIICRYSFWHGVFLFFFVPFIIAYSLV